MICTELGCWTRDAALASRWNRFTKERSELRSSFMILRATSRGSASCSATNTVAIPPSPRKRLIVNRPATWRPISAFWRMRVVYLRGGGVNSDGVENPPGRQHTKERAPAPRRERHEPHGPVEAD